MKETDAEFKWFNTTFYPKKRISTAARYEDGILPRMRGAEVNLFTPWGPRYNETIGSKIGENDPEVKTLLFLRDILGEMQNGMPSRKFHWTFLGADTYGTKINNLPTRHVEEYFESLSVQIEELIPGSSFKLWSDFDLEAKEYREEVRGNFARYVDDNLLQRASNTASKMKRGGDPKAYLIERIAEAMLIERKFKPIKISCVRREKDDKVDFDLPRLYFVPKELHAPWM